MKKILIASIFAFVSVCAMAQTPPPLRDTTKLLVDNTTLIVDPLDTATAVSTAVNSKPSECVKACRVNNAKAIKEMKATRTTAKHAPKSGSSTHASAKKKE